MTKHSLVLKQTSASTGQEVSLSTSSRLSSDWKLHPEMEVNLMTGGSALLQPPHSSRPFPPQYG